MGTSKTYKLEAMSVAVDHLVALCSGMKEAQTYFNDAVKAVAETSGLDAPTVRSYIVAKCGDKFDEKKEKCAQLMLVFDEVK